MPPSIPGPRAPAAWNLLRYARNPAGFFAHGLRRHGPVFQATFAGMGTFVFLGDPGAIRDVFHGDPEVLRTGEANAFAAGVLGRRSILLLDGEEHARVRRALAPPFHGSRLAAYAPVLRDVAEAEMSRWRPGETVTLEDACREMALQAILRFVFGPGPAEDLAEPFRRLVRVLSSPLAFAAAAVPRWLRPLTPARRVDRALADLDAAVHARLATAAAPEGTLLAVLRTLRGPAGEPPGPQDLRDHVVSLVLAGHDTTSIALAWAFGHIHSRPDVLSRILEEVRAPDADEAALEDGRQPWLNAAIRESLRLRPLVDYCVRRLRAPFTAAGTTYPAGVTLAPCMLLLHHRPDLYPDPHAFRPERFLDRRPDPDLWIPFGGGVRRCLGMDLALLEMRVLITTILRRVSFAPRPGWEPAVARRGLFLAPADRARLVLHSMP